MGVDEQGLWIDPDDITKTLNKIVILKVNSNKLQELHERYGHISFTTLKTLPEVG